MKRVSYLEKHVKITTKPYELLKGTSRLSFKSIARESITRELQSKFEN